MGAGVGCRSWIGADRTATRVHGGTKEEALAVQAETWEDGDSLFIADYSSPLSSGRHGSHAHTLGEERSVLRALAVARGDGRLVERAG